MVRSALPLLAATLTLALAGCGADRSAISLTDLDAGYAPLAGKPAHDVVTGQTKALQTGQPAYDAFFRDLTLTKASVAAARQVVTNARGGNADDAALAKAAVPAAKASLTAAGSKIPALRAKAATLTAQASKDFSGSTKDAVLAALTTAKDDLDGLPGVMTGVLVDLAGLTAAK